MYELRLCISISNVRGKSAKGGGKFAKDKSETSLKVNFTRRDIAASGISVILSRDNAGNRKKDLDIDMSEACVHVCVR